MKIVHLSNTPLSNSPSNLAQIQRDAGHDSVALLHRQQNVNKVFVGGDLWIQMDPEDVRHRVQSADVIHMHNFAWSQEIFKYYPDLIDIVKTKPCLLQYHSPRNSLESFEDTLTDSFFDGRRAVVAQYQVRQYPEAQHIVPNVLPIFDPRFMPINRAGNKPLISFSPSNTLMRGWDDKGFDQTAPIMNRLEREGIANADIILRTPYDETLARKRFAHIGIEEIVTGSYHLSFLEYMSLGCATFCNMDAQTRDAMQTIVGPAGMNTLPAVQTSVATLREDLLRTLKEPARLREMCEASRKWMEMYWNPRDHVKTFERIYDNL